MRGYTRGEGVGFGPRGRGSAGVGADVSKALTARRLSDFESRTRRLGQADHANRHPWIGPPCTTLPYFRDHRMGLAAGLRTLGVQTPGRRAGVAPKPRGRVRGVAVGG